MEDDELCFGIRPWCQREDYRSAFGISLSEPLFTITDTLQQSVLSTLKFPEVVAKSVSVDGPVRVDNIDQHVRIRSEIIIPAKSIIASQEDPQQKPNCPESGRKPCRDPVRPTRGDEVNDDECDDDDEEEEDEVEEEDGEEEDQEEFDEDEEEQDDEGYKDALEFLDDYEDDDEEEDASMQQCSNKGPQSDAPAGKRMPQAPSKYPTEIPVKKQKEKETEKETVENVCREPESKPDTDVKTAEVEAQKERTPEEEKELTDLHEECLYLSKEELEAICTKYKTYDKRFRVKRAKSGQTGVCKFKTNNKQKDAGTVGEKQQEEATKEEDNEYFCEEAGSENVAIDVEEDDECEDDDEKEKEKEESEINEKDADDAEEEDYEDEDEAEPYYGADRPCRASPTVCERSNAEKAIEFNTERIPRDYSRYDQNRYDEKEKDIFFKLSPKFALDAKGSKGHKQMKSDVVCDDDNKQRNKQSGLFKSERPTEIFNNKLAPTADTIYYCSNTVQEITSNKRNKRTVKEDMSAPDIKQRTTEDEYFACKRNEPQNTAKTEREQKEVCSQEYYTASGNNNNNSDNNEEDGGYFESSEGLLKDDDGDDRCDYASNCGGFAYNNSHVDEAEDNKNESCGVATSFGEHARYNIQSKAQNCGTAEKMQPVSNYSCPENTRNQRKYQAYGHSGDDDADDRYFTSTVLSSGKDARKNKTMGVNRSIFTPADPNYFTSGVEGPTSLPFSVGGLEMSPFEHLSADVVSMTDDHFEHCKRVFESMKQRAFGDDFEDYFESCISSNLVDSLEANLPSSDPTPPVVQPEPAPIPERKRPISDDEECEAKRNGFLKSLFGIISKSGIKQNRKNGKTCPDVETNAGDVCQPAKTKAVEKRFFNFGRYKEKYGEKAGNKNGCVTKRIKESNDSLPGKSEKRKFRFGKTSGDKRQKKVDTTGMIENFLAIEKTANQYYAIDDDFEIKNNGYIFKCGKLMKRLHTGDAGGLVSERHCPDGERQQSGETGERQQSGDSGETQLYGDNGETQQYGDTERSSATNEAFSGKAFQATTAAGDCDQVNGTYWSQTENPLPEAPDIKKTSHPEIPNVSREEEFPGDLELTAPHKLANDVVRRSSQTDLLENLPSVGNIRDATLMHSVSEISEKVDLGNQAEGTRKAYSAPDANSACVQTIVSDDLSNMDALKTSLCGFPMSPSENKNTKPEKPKRKVSSFLVVSKTVDKRPEGRFKPLHKVIRRKITEQEAIIISSHDKKIKEGKSPGKSQNDQERRPQTAEGCRSKENKSTFNYGNHIHKSKSLNRTAFRDSNTTGDLHPSEFKMGLDENGSTSLLSEKIYNWPLRIHEEKVRKKYQDTKSSRRNKSADCLINVGYGIHALEKRHLNEDEFGNLQPSISPYIARTSLSSERAKSDTRLQKQKSVTISDSWLHRRELPECDANVKNSFRHKQFVNRNVQGDRKIPRDAFGHRKAKKLLSKVIYDENHNVNCGADDDDMDNCQPQTVNNIIFSDKQQPIPHVRNKIEVLSMEDNQPSQCCDERGSNNILDSFVLNETVETNAPFDAVIREYNPVDILESGCDNSTGWNNPQTEETAESNINELHQIQIPLTEEPKVNTAMDTRVIEQINTAAVHLESKSSSSETVSQEAANFLLNVGDSTNVESFLGLGETGKQQSLYNGELGMVQDCSGSHWEIEPSVHEDYLIVNSKNENVVYHFQSENRPIWKLGDYDDIDGPLHDARDENVNQGRYTKYDSVDDGRNGAIFDENQLMRCSHVRTAASDSGGRPRSKERGIFPDKRSRAPGEYDTGTSYGDRSVERKPSLGPGVESTKYGYSRNSSSQRKDQGAWEPQEAYETNKEPDCAGSYCTSCVGKAWRFADAFLKNGSDEVKDSYGWVDGTYTSEWNDGSKWQTATAHQENKREDGREREFWGEYIYSTVGNYGKTRTPTAVNIDASVAGRRDPEFWNNTVYNTTVNNMEKASVIPDGYRGEAKDNDFWATALYSLANNTNEQTKKKNEDMNEHVSDEFWSDRLYSPTRKGKVNWKTIEQKSDEVNSVVDSHINTEENMAKCIPVRDERKIHVPSEKESAGASKINSREADIKAERDRKNTRQFPALTLQARPFLHHPEQYVMQTHKNKPRNDPGLVVPSKDIPAENKGKPISMSETCKEGPCLQDKPINIYEISKPTVIKPKPNNTGDASKAAGGKEKRNNVNEAFKEKPSNARETAKSTWNRRKEHNIYETSNAVMREEKQRKSSKAGNKDTKKSEPSGKTRHTSSSEATKKMADAKVEHIAYGKELVSRNENIGDWFTQDKMPTSPEARRSVKRDSEENPSREPRFASGGKHKPYLLKLEVREAGVAKEEQEAHVERDKAHDHVPHQKPAVQSESLENATGDKVIYVNPCGDGTRKKKWKLYIVSERKPAEGNTKQDVEAQPAMHHQVSKSRESKERVQLGVVNTATRQLAVKLSERPTTGHAEDESSMRQTNGQSRANLKTSANTSQGTRQQPETRKTKRANRDEHGVLGERKDIINVSDKKRHEPKGTKESAEQHRKQNRVYKLDIDEHFKVYDHKVSAGMKPSVNAMQEYGLGQLLQLTAHSRDRDSERFKMMLGKHEDKQNKPTKARVFKIDCEERISDKSRRRTKDATARKPKAPELMDHPSLLAEPSKRPARVIDKEEKDRANKAFFDRYRHRQRHQKSDTMVTEGHKNLVENSKSEVLSSQPNPDDNQHFKAFKEEKRKPNSSRKEERKKWKEEIHRTRYRSESKNANNIHRVSAHRGLEENSDIETPNTYSYLGYMSNSGQGEGLKHGESDSYHTQETAGESCVDVVPARPDIASSVDVPRIEFDQRSRASSSKYDSEAKKCVYRQSKENRRRHDAVKKSRTDTNQTDRFVPTLIDSSVVNTVARAWMDDTERLGINSLQEAKLFSPSVLLQQTSGSLSANCHYMNTPREMINTPELTNQHNPMTIGGDYFDIFPRPTFLPVRRYQNFDSGEHTHKASASSDNEYASCKLCPKGYFDTYTNDEDRILHQAGYLGDTQGSQEKELKKEKNPENSKRPKPFYHNSEKVSSAVGRIVTRSYFASADKASENRRHTSKDDSFLNVGHSHKAETGVSKFADKNQSRQSRLARTPERSHAATDHPTSKQPAQERKSADPRNIKRVSETSKNIRKIESADNVKPSVETSKAVKTAHEHAKPSEQSHMKPQAENTQSNATPSDGIQGKGHMFSYKVSSKGNRPEVVKALPRQQTQADVESPAAYQEIVGPHLETVRNEPAPEPPQMGLFARILNTLTRANNNQAVASQTKEEGVPKVETNATAKSDSNERVPAPNTADDPSTAKEKNTSSTKNKSLRSRNPLPTRDAKTLRPDYKQNMNCNAVVRPGKLSDPSMDSFASMNKLAVRKNRSRQNIKSAVANGKICMQSLTTALEWNAILLIVIFSLYLGTCCPGLLKRYLYCPLPSVWELLYKYGLISLGIDAFLISKATTKPFTFGSKGPQKGVFYSFVGKYLCALIAPLVYAATLLYTYLQGPFLSAICNAVMKVITYALLLLIYVCNYILCYFQGSCATQKPSSFGGMNIEGRTPFYPRAYQLKHGCDFTFWESLYLKATNRYPAKCL